MLIEFVLYNTAAEVDGQDHLQQTQKAHEAVIASQEGFHSRAMGIPSGEAAAGWADLVIWESPKHVHAAMETIGRAPEAQPWTAQMVQDGMVMRTADVLYRLNRNFSGVSDEADGAWLIVTWKALADIDFDKHVAGSKAVHKAVLQNLPGYRGGLLGYDAKREEFVEVLAWDNLEAAQASYSAAMASSAPIFAEHMAECDEESVTVTFVTPALRFTASSVRASVG